MAPHRARKASTGETAEDDRRRFFHLETQAVSAIFERNAISMFTGEDDEIQRKIVQAETQERTQKVALDSIVHSRTPLSLIVSSRRVQFGLVLVVGLWLWEVATAGIVLNRLWRHRHFRLIPTSLRSGKAPQGSFGLSDFRLYLDGCMLAEHNATAELSQDQSMLVKSFQGDVAVNGFSVVTGEWDPSEDAVAFRLEGSSDLQAWEVVGASSWRFRPWDHCFAFSHHSARIPRARGAEVVLEPRLSPEPRMLFISRICSSVLLVAAALLGWHDKRREASVLLLMCLLVLASCDLATAGIHTAASALRNAFFPLCSGCVFLTVAVGLTVGAAGRRLVRLMGVGLGWVVLSIVDSVVLWGDTNPAVSALFQAKQVTLGVRWQAVLWAVPLVAWAMSVLFVCCSLVHRRSLERSRQAMEGVEREYNAAWGAMLCAAPQEEWLALRELTALLDQVSRLTSRAPPRHHIQAVAPPFAAENLNSEGMGNLPRAGQLRKMATAGRHRLKQLATAPSHARVMDEAGGRGSEATLVEEEPQRVVDADQVYVQAAGLLPLFRAKVLRWAAASDGCLRVKLDLLSNGPDTAGDSEPGTTTSGYSSWNLLRKKRASWASDMSSSRLPMSSPKRAAKRASLACTPRRTSGSSPQERPPPIPFPPRVVSDPVSPDPSSPARSRKRSCLPPPSAREGLATDFEAVRVASPKRSLDATPAHLLASSGPQAMGAMEGDGSRRRSLQSLNNVRRVVSLITMNTFSTSSSLDRQEAEPSQWARVAGVDADRVVWEGLKSKTRAANKILKVYSGDASRLVDVCRQRILFDSIGALLRCVQEVLRDKDNVRVLRVKNMLGHDHDARWSAGFRAVIINLAIVVPQTVALSLNMHVAELQLVLRSFADIQEAADHAQYIRYRNARSSAPESFGVLRALQPLLPSRLRRHQSRVAAAPPPPQGKGLRPEASLDADNADAVLTATGFLADAAAKQPPSHHTDLDSVATAPSPLGRRSAELVDDTAVATPRVYDRPGAAWEAGGQGDTALAASSVSEQASARSTAAHSHSYTLDIASNAPASDRSDPAPPPPPAPPSPVIRVRRQSLNHESPPPAQPAPASLAPHRDPASRERRASLGSIGRPRRVSIGNTIEWGRSLFGSTGHRQPDSDTAAGEVAGIASEGGGWRWTHADLQDVTGKGQKPWLEWTQDRLSAVFADMEPLDRVLKDLVVMGARQAGGRLRKRMEGALHEAVRGARMESVSFSSTPLPAMASYRRVQVALVVAAALFVVSASSFHADTSTRLLALRASIAPKLSSQLANGPTEERILGGGLLFNGCPVGEMSRGAVGDGIGSLIAFPGGLEANGWYLVKEHDSHDDRDHSQLDEDLVHASGLREEDREWACLFRGESDSNCIQTLSGDDGRSWRLHEILFPGLESEMVLYSEDLRADVGSLLGWVLVPALRALAHAGVAVSGALKATPSSRWIFGGLQVVVATLLWVVGGMQDQDGAEALWWYIRGVAMLVLGLAVLWQHRGLVLVQAFSSVVEAAAVHSLMRFRVAYKWADAGYGDMWVLTAGPELLLLGLCLYLWAGWRVALWWSGRMIKHDRAAYDAEWLRILEAEGGREELRLLEETVAGMRLGEEVPRQRVRTEAAGGLALTLTDGTTTPTSGRAALELDQLYAQAYVVDFLLRGKLGRWAGQCNGYLRGKGTAGDAGSRRWIKFSECEARPELRGQIQWGGVKRVERAIEKTLRSYHGDVSRLVDVTRGCVAFECVSDLQQCLAAIVADDECHVLRVKNRLSLGYDASQSAGYRDVALNLQMRCPDAQRLKLDGHVAELQLILLPFARLKSDQGHKRYVHFRNARAE